MSNRELLTKLLIFGVSYSLCPTLPTDNKKPAEARLHAGFRGFFCYILLSVAASLAEEEGFEPSVDLHLRLISSQVHSTTLPPLRCLFVA
jgi:hypothetical protein